MQLIEKSLQMLFERFLPRASVGNISIATDVHWFAGRKPHLL
jgi:hypothetical protein